jgi:glycosyltransferase involved in cell wall biosynthesis
LNLLFLVEGAAGAGRYVSELLPALRSVAPRSAVTTFVGRDAPQALFEQPWSSDIDWVRLPVSTKSRTHVVAQMAAVPSLALQRGLDVLHSPANVGPPIAPAVATVVTLLDLIWLHQRDAWDPSLAGRAMGLVSRICARRADRVIAISHAARDDMVETLGIAAGKIDVAPLGVRVPNGRPSAGQSSRSRFDLGDGPVVLCVAQKRPYKNLGSLIRAVPELEERATLVLAGAPTEHEKELRALADELGVADRVRLLGWVSEEELDGLYGVASCFVLPSLIEGFGLPVLEAMARDVPVACSDRTAMAEVAGDAALLFDPTDQQAVTGAVRRLLLDRELAASLVRRGRDRVRLFTWERTAEATLESYRRAVAGKAARRRV